MDLPDPPKRLQVPGEVRATHGGPNTKIAPRERTDHVPADESRAAEDGDEGVEIGPGGHATLFAPGCSLRRAIRAGEYRIAVHVYSAIPAGRALTMAKAEPYLCPRCPGGGTGRRAGFRYQW